MTRLMPLRILVALSMFTLTCAPVAYAKKGKAPTRNLNLPVVEIRQTYDPYALFCKRNPGHCEMTGTPIIELTEKVHQTLSKINTAINTTINCKTSDLELYGVEEYWAYPSEGKGDCEDMALEKRKRLAQCGIPRAAMTMAIVHHKKTLAPHAVLLIETTSGTYVLDSFTNEIILWHEAPFNYETRERIDGTWERYDQGIWTYQ